MGKPPFLSDSIQFSVFYLGGPLGGKCLTRGFRHPLQVGETLSQMLSVDNLPHGRGFRTGEAGPLIVYAEYEVTHINGLVAVASFVQTKEHTQRVVGWNRPPQSPQD